ncbi:MAG TPA: carboxypeptidase regulatory-like domain-containing protein [Vicinamibacterales bacterium]|nr:carboxypeptidase regulatory-like domain-containing protein [Vicinamibacterales bacterium]
MQLLVALPIAVALFGVPGIQTPAQPAPAQTQPAAPRPRPRAARPPATAVLTVTVTDARGAALADVTVSAIGPVDREGVTTAAGQVRLLGIRAGSYRLRFEKDGFYTFEKEVSWRAGTPAPATEATLTPAPPPPPPPEPPVVEAPPPAVPDLPAGKPTTMSLLDHIERNFISNKEPQKESLVGCSGGAQSWLWQVRDPWQNRQHDDAELMLYVVGGDGTLRMEGRDIPVAAGSFAVVPRGTEYGFTRRGRNPLIMLATLSGPPCAQ